MEVGRKDDKNKSSFTHWMAPAHLLDDKSVSHEQNFDLEVEVQWCWSPSYYYPFDQPQYMLLASMYATLGIGLRFTMSGTCRALSILPGLKFWIKYLKSIQVNDPSWSLSQIHADLSP